MLSIFVLSSFYLIGNLKFTHCNMNHIQSTGNNCFKNSLGHINMPNIQEVTLLVLFWLLFDQRVASNCSVTPCDVYVTFRHKLSKPLHQPFPCHIQTCLLKNSILCGPQFCLLLIYEGIHLFPTTLVFC